VWAVSCGLSRSKDTGRIGLNGKWPLQVRSMSGVQESRAFLVASCWPLGVDFSISFENEAKRNATQDIRNIQDTQDLSRMAGQGGVSGMADKVKYVRFQSTNNYKTGSHFSSAPWAVHQGATSTNNQPVQCPSSPARGWWWWVRNG